MNILKIEIIDDKLKKIFKESRPLCQGKMIIGDFEYLFYFNYDTWCLKDYKLQWKQGLERIKNYNSSCIVTSITLSKKPFVEIWYLYKKDNKILVQLQFLAGYIFDERAKGLPPFDLETCYQYVRNVRSFSLYNEEGYELQTWEADLEGIITDNL